MTAGSRECEKALGTITSQFQEKESSVLEFPAADRGLRQYPRDRLPALAVRQHPAPLLQRQRAAQRRHRSTPLNYSIIEDGGFAGFGQGVEWCVVGLDRNWAYNPACKAAAP